jgi:hypothetical protein
MKSKIEELIFTFIAGPFLLIMFRIYGMENMQKLTDKLNKLYD